MVYLKGKVPTKGVHMAKNPFLSDPLQGGILETRYEVKREKSGTDKSNYNKIRLIDKDPKTSIYRISAFEKSLYTLSPTANKIYHYITIHLGKDRDLISLPQDKVCLITDIKSRRTFYNGIKELIKINLIAKFHGRANMYWINPHYMFNGSRMDFIKTKYGEDIVEISFKTKN